MVIAGLGSAARAEAQCEDVGIVDVLTDGAGFLWDVQLDGNIWGDNSDDPYDGGLVLAVNGTYFPPVTSGSEMRALSGREIILGPQTMSGLEVTRAVYVPTTAAWARFVDTFENSGTTDVTVTVRLESNLGSDGDTNIFATSSGDMIFSAMDRWVLSDDGPADDDPTMAHVYWGAGGRVMPTAATPMAFDCGSTNGQTVTFSVTVAAGGRAMLLYFGSQTGDQAEAMATATSLETLSGPALAGLDASEAADIVNWEIDCSMRTEACNAADDDCDSSIDEGFDLDSACSDGTGACERTGMTECTADGMDVQCDATAGMPGAELCNGTDDDCDGVPDVMEAVCMDSGLPPVDAGPMRDSGPPPDTGPRPDTGPVPDAGPGFDSGPRRDAGPAGFDVHGSGVLCSTTGAGGASRDGLVFFLFVAAALATFRLGRSRRG
jgi:hypothetical protein